MIHFRLRRFVRLAVDLLSLHFAEPFTRFLFAPAADRRYLASTGVLLALSLEACGCNPVMDPSVVSAPFTYGGTNGEIASAEPTLAFYDPDDQSPVPFSSAASIGELSPDLRHPPLAAKSAPWAIPESVYLIYRSGRPEEPRPDQPPLATAFVVSVPSPDPASSDPGRVARFLVTARHVVDPQWARCAEPNPVSIDVRLNRRAGGVAYETLSLKGRGTRSFFTPSDPTADLAVIPLDNTVIAHLDDYKFLDVPFRILPSASDMALIHPDQPVMTAGLSTLPGGEPASFPVFDAGYLSTMPADAVDVHCGKAKAQGLQPAAKPLHIWFISAGVPQGVSGAPVFTSIARGPDAVRTPVLLGVQSVDWPDAGMAGITPSPVLADLIRSALRESNPDPGLSTGRNPRPGRSHPNPRSL